MLVFHVHGWKYKLKLEIQISEPSLMGTRESKDFGYTHGKVIIL